MPALPLAIAVAACFTGLLISEPDVGQTLLVSAVWATLYFLSGQALLGAGIIAVCGAMGAAFAYSLVRPRALSRRQVLRPDTGRQLASSIAP